MSISVIRTMGRWIPLRASPKTNEFLWKTNVSSTFDDVRKGLYKAVDQALLLDEGLPGFSIKSTFVVAEIILNCMPNDMMWEIEDEGRTYHPARFVVGSGKALRGGVPV
jgi:hypothetical protein